MQKNLILVNLPRKGFLRPIPEISLALLYLAGAARDAGVCDSISIFDFNTPIGKGKSTDELTAHIASNSGGIPLSRSTACIPCSFRQFGK